MVDPPSTYSSYHESDKVDVLFVLFVIDIGGSAIIQALPTW